MEKQWFVLHTLSGQENRVKESIERRAKIEDMQEYVGEVLVPTERVTETKSNRRTTTVKKFFPGYVLINLALYDAQKNLAERAWYFVQETPGIIGFVGGERPVPLRPSEIDTILSQVEEKKDKVRPKVMFDPGETVTITDGPFQSFSGVVEEVDPEHGKLKVSVSIFGRSTPVELEYSQVERA
ncbi:MAG: transcription termination/antitermination protein NusG [Verrucomicrobia bacterium A1]|nr:MAG: transcription termination/antitermination protein NusG [Verrucomicrobia bacterium A1]